MADTIMAAPTSDDDNSSESEKARNSALSATNDEAEHPYKNDEEALIFELLPSRVIPNCYKRMKDDLPFYNGMSRMSRLRELRQFANDNHSGYVEICRKSLDHARIAGAALNEAKRITGCGGKWTKWLVENFQGSHRSAQTYMRIARHWNDPRIVHARLDGINVDSIDGFDKILRNKKSKGEGTNNKNGHSGRLADINALKQEAARQFNAKIRSVKDVDDLTTLAEYAMIDATIWPSVMETVKDMRRHNRRWRWGQPMPQSEDDRIRWMISRNAQEQPVEPHSWEEYYAAKIEAGEIDKSDLMPLV